MLLLCCSRCGSTTDEESSVLRYYHGQQVRTCHNCLRDGGLFVPAADMIQRAYARREARRIKGYNVCFSDGCREPVYDMGLCRDCWEWMMREEGDDASALDHAEQDTRDRQDAEAQDRAGVRPCVPDRTLARFLRQGVGPWLCLALGGSALGFVVAQVGHRLGWWTP